MAEWREIPDFPGWAVTDEGEILNLRTNKFITPRQNKQGVTMVNLVRDHTIYTRSLALLVATAYLGDPPNMFYNSVIHMNGDRTNCRVENLAWRPRGFAQAYHRMFRQPPYDVAVYICDTDESFASLRAACVKYGLVENQTYRDIINMQPCFHYNWIFRRYRE